MEEYGELARVVLPYDGADGTSHRFVEKERVLEESVHPNPFMKFPIGSQMTKNFIICVVEKFL